MTSGTTRSNITIVTTQTLPWRQTSLRTAGPVIASTAPRPSGDILAVEEGPRSEIRAISQNASFCGQLPDARFEPYIGYESIQPRARMSDRADTRAYPCPTALVRGCESIHFFTWSAGCISRRQFELMIKNNCRVQLLVDGFPCSQNAAILDVARASIVHVIDARLWSLCLDDGCLEILII